MNVQNKTKKDESFIFLPSSLSWNDEWNVSRICWYFFFLSSGGFFSNFCSSPSLSSAPGSGSGGRTPGKRGSAAQNAVALLVHRAGRVSVERRERGPRRCSWTGPGWVVRRRRRWRLPQQSRVRLQRQLQVQDVVDNVLQDLHFADFLVGRDGGHQPPQAAVAVVHIALQAQRWLVGRRLGRLAASCRRRGRRGRRAAQAVAVLGQAAQRQLPATAARRRLTARGAHRAHRLHRARPAFWASGPAGASEGGRQGPGPHPRPAPLPLPPRPVRSVSARGTAKLPAIPRPTIDGRVALRFARGSLLCGPGPKGKKNQKHRKESSPPGSLVTSFRTSDYSPVAAALPLARGFPTPGTDSQDRKSVV